MSGAPRRGGRVTGIPFRDAIQRAKKGRPS